MLSELGMGPCAPTHRSTGRAGSALLLGERLSGRAGYLARYDLTSYSGGHLLRKLEGAYFGRHLKRRYGLRRLRVSAIRPRHREGD